MLTARNLNFIDDFTEPLIGRNAITAIAYEMFLQSQRR